MSIGATGLNTARLKPWQIWLLVAGGGVLWATGATWLVLYYFFRTQGPYGSEVNPAEPLLLEIHGAAVPVMILAAGSLLAAHIPKGWSYRRQRVVGLSMVTILGLLIVSSHFLRYAIDEDLRDWASTLHWVIGLGLPAFFAYHWRRGLRSRAVEPPQKGT